MVKKLPNVGKEKKLTKLAQLIQLENNGGLFDCDKWRNLMQKSLRAITFAVALLSGLVSKATLLNSMPGVRRMATETVKMRAENFKAHVEKTKEIKEQSQQQLELLFEKEVLYPTSLEVKKAARETAYESVVQKYPVEFILNVIVENDVSLYVETVAEPEAARLQELGVFGLNEPQNLRSIARSLSNLNNDIDTLPMHTAIIFFYHHNENFGSKYNIDDTGPLIRESYIQRKDSITQALLMMQQAQEIRKQKAEQKARDAKMKEIFG